MCKTNETSSGLNRREFLTLAGVVGVGLLAPTLFPLSKALAADPLDQAPLP